MVMSTVPEAEATGDVATICVAEFTVNVVAAVVPKRTAVAPVKSVPVMVTEVPPVVRPVAGDTPVTVGADVNRKISAATCGLVPLGVTTLKCTDTAACPTSAAATE